MPRPRQRCDSVHPLHFGGVAHQQSARLTCERQRGRHSPLPPFSEGIAQSARADASHASGRRRKSCPHQLVSLWCNPANTPASHAGDHRSEAGQGHQFPARGSREIADPPDSESGSLGRAIRPAPTSFMPPKHLQRCACSVSRPAWCNSVWGLHFHNSNAVEPALRQVSYARCAQGSTGDCDQPSLVELRLGGPFNASMQQPADYFRKAILAGAAPAGGSHFRSRSPMQRHDVESVASAGANPAASTIFGLQALK